MKIFVLNGSPKKKSDTFRMTEAFLRGLNRNGEQEVHVIHAIDKQIAPCRGCFGCWQRMDGHCVILDDQNAILDLYWDADVIIWSFPLYCYAIPSHLKAVLDRTIPLVKNGYEAGGGWNSTSRSAGGFFQDAHADHLWLRFSGLVRQF